jgi:hypothetical protein
MAKSEDGTTGFTSRSTRARSAGFDRGSRADEQRVNSSSTENKDRDSSVGGKLFTPCHAAALTEQPSETEQRLPSSTDKDNQVQNTAEHGYQKPVETPETPAIDASNFADSGSLCLQSLSIKTVSVDVFDKRKPTDPERLTNNAGQDEQNPTSLHSATLSASDQLQKIKCVFQDQFAANADDTKAFHSMMQTVFGNQYIRTAAESIRLQALSGDYSWMPDIQITIGAALADTSGTQDAGIGLGAYDSVSDTVYLSEELLAGEMDHCLYVLTEEVGHALDTRVNTVDSVGDEGELFAKLMTGENLSEADIATIRAENDHGTMVVDGKSREIEYSWHLDVEKNAGNATRTCAKAAGGAISDDVNSVAGAISRVVRRARQLFK